MPPKMGIGGKTPRMRLCELVNNVPVYDTYRSRLAQLDPDPPITLSAVQISVTNPSADLGRA